jgi:hypothetical protein
MTARRPGGHRRRTTPSHVLGRVPQPRRRLSGNQGSGPGRLGAAGQPAVAHYSESPADLKPFGDRQRAAFDALANRLWGSLDGKTVSTHPCGKGSVMWGQSIGAALTELRVAPDFAASPAGQAWKPGTELDVSGTLQRENELVVSVVNVYRNRFIGDLTQFGEIRNLRTSSPITDLLARDEPLKRSGLLGPLKLTRIGRQRVPGL